MATNATATATAAALQYKEPDIRSVLILSSFLLLLNLVSSILDNVCYCGLVGQVLLGMAWGSPGAKWLSSSLEEAATQLGYLGLIAIVFEGGLAASAKSMQNTFFLSICVALTGILLPIALSFSLVALASATKLQAFAAGAALCSTSLGTTFSLLKTTGLTTSRLGTVLTSAAMLDDVVGLIMVQVIANLGSGRGSIHPSTILRPVFVSVGFATVLPLACKYVVRPFAEKRLFDNTNRPALLNRVVTGTSVGFVLMTAFLMALVSAASYAGTSNLFAAYLAGAIVAWVDENSLLPNAMQTPQPVDSPPQKATRDRPSSASLAQTQGISCSTPTTSEQCADIVNRSPKGAGHATPPPETTSDEDAAVPTPPASAPKMAEKEQLISMHIFNRYYAPAVDSILKPLFFASIGFSIPITKMFEGSVVWRGLVYTILMSLGKLCCGLWLVRFRIPPSKPTPNTSAPRKRTEKANQRAKRKPVPRPKSLYPASLLGCAMIARGEIGFLVSAIADSNGIFADETANLDSRSTGDSSNENGPSISELYMIVTWAILLCTIIGPLALGLLARRVQRLQRQRTHGQGGGGEDPLGVWGVL